MKVPKATYRLQLNPDFGFVKMERILPYLKELGIDTVYVSPILRSRKGSTHGYDVVDSTELNEELGSREDFESVAEQVKNLDMGWIQDIVPNHMAFDGQNKFLMDIFENGEFSEYYNFFDIEWQHPYQGYQNRVLAPFLGGFYGKCLEDGELRLKYNSQGLNINYYDLSFPLRVETYYGVLSYKLFRLKNKLGKDHPNFIKFLGILYVLKTLDSSEDIQERQDQIRFIKRVLWELYNRDEIVKKYLDENLHTYNGRVGDPGSFNLLDALLSEQMFRLSFWKVGSEEINYKRFFNVNELISVAVQNEKVFQESHALIFKLLHEGKISGLRIDHIDGLYDPLLYLRNVKTNMRGYVVAEKILEYQEELPDNWPNEGTTGYEFLALNNGIFVYQDSERDFTRIYNRFSGTRTNPADLIFDKKQMIIEKHMSGEVDNLAHRIKNISGKYRYASDLTFTGLKEAIEDVMIFFPIYRTYGTRNYMSEADRSYIRETIGRASHFNPALLYEFEFIEKILTLDFDDYLSEDEKKEWVDFLMHFQQYTGALMAKGVEDTAFYIYNRLLSLNEVGGSLLHFGFSVEDFHRANEKRLRRWPYNLNASSTHDTKRSEDVRARLNVLSEMPKDWEAHLKQWSVLNRFKKKKIENRLIPDKNDEYFLYQILLGTYPFSGEHNEEYVKRIQQYIVKAVREAKVYTAWLKPDTEYEEVFINFIEKILDSKPENLFLRHFKRFQKKLAYFGVFNSLSQTILKITTPGVPDFYQGCEVWNFSLVDPDNRRFVDYEHLSTLLSFIKKKERSELIAELMQDMTDERHKIYLIYHALDLRKKHPQIFAHGDYIPAEILGKHKHRVVAFFRKFQDQWVLIAVPRFLSGLIHEQELPLGHEIWEDTAISIPEIARDKSWENILTGEKLFGGAFLSVGDIFQTYPIGLLGHEFLKQMKEREISEIIRKSIEKPPVR